MLFPASWEAIPDCLGDEHLLVRLQVSRGNPAPAFGQRGTGSWEVTFAHSHKGCCPALTAGPAPDFLPPLTSDTPGEGLNVSSAPMRRTTPRELKEFVQRRTAS